MRAPERTLAAVAAAVALAVLATAQDAPERGAGLAETDVYRREVFQYQAGGRPDPFQPLLTGEDIGVRVQDLTLEGIVYSPTPGASVASFSLPGSEGRTRLRVGQRLGAVTVVAIHPRRVDVREDQFGVSRAYSLELQRRSRVVPDAAPPQAEPPPPAQPAPAAPAPQGARP